jgi:hypothetical protein
MTRYFISENGQPSRRSYNRLELLGMGLLPDHWVLPDVPNSGWIKAGEVEELFPKLSPPVQAREQDVLQTESIQVPEREETLASDAKQEEEPPVPIPLPKKLSPFKPEPPKPVAAVPAHPQNLSPIEILRPWRWHLAATFAMVALAWLLMHISECNTRRRIEEKAAENFRIYQDSLKADRERKEQERLAREAEQARINSIKATPEYQRNECDSLLKVYGTELAQLEQKVAEITRRHTEIVQPSRGLLKKANGELRDAKRPPATQAKKASQPARIQAAQEEVTRLTEESIGLEKQREKARESAAELKILMKDMEAKINDLTKQIEEKQRLQQDGSQQRDPS